MILQWAEISGKILDNGCGLGTWLEAFSPYSKSRFGLEVELERAKQARLRASAVVQGIGEHLPFADNSLDFVLSNEVIEHVEDDHQVLAEMIRVTKPGGRVVIFCPNRWYPVEQHGIFWRDKYIFGNIPLVNYLPDILRDRLAPHVRTYTAGRLHELYRNLPVRVVHHSRIYGGYDNIQARWPRFASHLKKFLYMAEKTPLALFGISHLLVLEKNP